MPQAAIILTTAKLKDDYQSTIVVTMPQAAIILTTAGAQNPCPERVSGPLFKNQKSLTKQHLTMITV